MDAQAPLTDRIAAALTGAITSDAVSALISEAGAQAATLKVRLDEAERVSLDPLASDDAVSAAADEVVRLGLAIRRQQAALQQLDARLAEVTDDEKRAREEAFRKEAVALRDAAVAAMQERYPKLAADLAALMRQCMAADAAVQSAEAGLSVELTLRPWQPGEIPGYYPTLAQALVLPNFESRKSSPIWNGRALG